MKTMNKLILISLLAATASAAFAFTTIETNIAPVSINKASNTAQFNGIVVNQNVQMGILRYNGSLTSFPAYVLTSKSYSVSVNLNGTKTAPIFYGDSEQVQGCYFQFSYNKQNGTLNIGKMAQGVPNSHCKVSANMIGVNAGS